MKFLLFTFGLLLSVPSLFAQNFYAAGELQDIKITFFQTNWDAKMDSLKNAVNDQGFLLAKSIEINGEVFDSVGVKYKGNSSYNANNAKNPLNIELDYVIKNQNYHGIQDIKLSNGFSDPTFIREALSYEILRQYMAAPQANHAKVSMNGVYWGLYTNVESINKSFARQHFFTDGKNPFFKCNPADIGGPGTGGNYPDLVYSSADSSFYYNKYEMRSDYGWRQLLNLMDTLKNNPAKVDKILDVDRALWMLAFNDICVNLDSYTGAFGQNYYLYYDDNNRWLPVVWDLNMCFGGFPLLSAGGGGGLSLTQMKQMDPLVQSANASRPLIQKLLANPLYKRMYLAHARTILQENFSNDDYKIRALELQAVIDAAVQADTKKFYTYANFLANVNTAVTGNGGGGFGSIPGITDLMGGRQTFLNNNAVFSAAAPSISAVVPVSGSLVRVNAQILNATAVTLAYRFDTSAVFLKTTMYDDGQHQDGTAGDGLYGGFFPALGTQAQYYVYAENGAAGRFSPERAEYEFYTVAATPLVPQAGEVVINEFLADNMIGAADEAGEVEDWLELYNNSSIEQILSGLYLTDDVTKPTKWAFPASVVLPSHSFLIVWLDENGLQGPFHANFKLNKGGEFLMLSDGAGLVLDSLTFGQQQTDVSTGRFPNGTGPFVAMPTTFDATNSLVSATGEVQNLPALRVSPNPVNGLLQLQSPVPLGRLEVLNALGQPVLTADGQGQTTLQLDFQTLPVGLYMIKTGLTRPCLILRAE